MNLTRTALIGVSGGALVVWIAAAATSPSRPPTVPVASPGRLESSGAELAAEIARLHERLRPTVQPMQSRDLFRYGSRSREAAVTPVEIAPVEPLAPPVPAAPPLRLVGLAEDAAADGPVRTAILSSPGGVLLVKDGDVVLSRYRVTKVSADAVDLIDADNRVLHLSLP